MNKKLIMLGGGEQKPLTGVYIGDEMSSPIVAFESIESNQNPVFTDSPYCRSSDNEYIYIFNYQSDKMSFSVYSKLNNTIVQNIHIIPENDILYDAHATIFSDANNVYLLFDGKYIIKIIKETWIIDTAFMQIPYNSSFSNIYASCVALEDEPDRVYIFYRSYSGNYGFYLLVLSTSDLSVIQRYYFSTAEYKNGDGWFLFKKNENYYITWANFAMKLDLNFNIISSKTVGGLLQSRMLFINIDDKLHVISGEMIFNIEDMSTRYKLEKADIQANTFSSLPKLSYIQDMYPLSIVDESRIFYLVKFGKDNTEEDAFISSANFLMLYDVYTHEYEIISYLRPRIYNISQSVVQSFTSLQVQNNNYVRGSQQNLGNFILSSTMMFMDNGKFNGSYVSINNNLFTLSSNYEDYIHSWSKYAQLYSSGFAGDYKEPLYITNNPLSYPKNTLTVESQTMNDVSITKSISAVSMSYADLSSWTFTQNTGNTYVYQQFS